jgi:hypothetical protein
MRIPTVDLEPGAVVLTTAPVGTDFGLPLVAPWCRKRTQPVQREVRSRHRAGGGQVVWFTDGTKSIPVHGRTAWLGA